LIKESNLDTTFESVFLELLSSEKKQSEMGGNMKKLALPNATKHIVDEIEKLLK